MKMNYLTKQEIQTISGAKMRKKIIPWLRSNGIPYIMDATGWPLVAALVRANLAEMAITRRTA